MYRIISGTGYVFIVHSDHHGPLPVKRISEWVSDLLFCCLLTLMNRIQLNHFMDLQMAMITKSRSMTGILLLMGVLLSGAAMQNVVNAQSDGQGLKVGVVDIRKVYESYDRAGDFRDRIQQKKKEAQSKIKDISNELNQIQEELNDLEPLSELWKKRAKKFYQLKSERKMMQDLWKQDTQKLLSETSAEIYQNIRDVIEEYGSENGYDLILKVNKSDIGSRDVSDVNQQIATRSVLHFADQMDLTNQITSMLNERYNEQSSDGSESGSGSGSNDSGGN